MPDSVLLRKFDIDFKLAPNADYNRSASPSPDRIQFECPSNSRRKSPKLVRAPIRTSDGPPLELVSRCVV
jgi:hypothetical protein